MVSKILYFDLFIIMLILNEQYKKANNIKHIYKFYMDYWHDIFMRCIPLSECFVVDNSNWMEYRTE